MAAMDKVVPAEENSSGQDSCGICDMPLSAADLEIIEKRKLNKAYCVQDNYALRGFQACCKSQGTETEMNQLKADNPGLWKETVRSFRDALAVIMGNWFFC